MAGFKNKLQSMVQSVGAKVPLRDPISKTAGAVTRAVVNGAKAAAKPAMNKKKAAMDIVLKNMVGKK